MEQKPRRITNQTGLFIGEADGTAHEPELDPLERTEPEGFNLHDSSLDMTAPDNLPPVQVEPEGVAEEFAATTVHDSYPTQAGGLDATEADETNYHDESVAANTIDRFDEPIAANLHSGRAFTVLKHADGSRRAIKIGNSWPALFFTLPWLFYKKLWGTAIVYVVLIAALLFALASSGFNLLDAGASATTEQKLVFAGFALLALVGWLYLPWRQGNKWAERKLERKGFNYHTAINAQSAKDALDLARD